MDILMTSLLVSKRWFGNPPFPGQIFCCDSFTETLLNCPRKGLEIES